jgi:hypothetical protein
MHHYARASLLVAALPLAASCSDTDARLSTTQPSVIGTSPFVVTATSSTAFAQPVADPVCPSVAPFNVPLGVTVTAHGSSVVVITRILVQFTDSMGRQAPQVTLPMLPVTLPAPGPTAQFGVTSQSAFVRTFPFAFGIGCGTGTRGTVVIIVQGSDHRGRAVAEQVTVPVR